MDLSDQKIKQFKILRPIGKGGMGEVYLAHDTVLDRKVAVKILLPSQQEDRKGRLRLVQEARAAAALDHPFICKIYETGDFQGMPFIAMEFIEGLNLKDKLDEGPLSEREALHIIQETAEALEKAHEKGILHRDLKPANIMLTPQGHVKVMDFGLAKRFLSGQETIAQTITQVESTEEGTISGTLAYMSPEQARGEKVDNRSDIFSLGIIMHELVTGRHPFLKPSPLETLTAILRDPPPFPKAKRKVAASAMDTVLHKALEKDPAQRYQSMTELMSDFQKVAKEASMGARLLPRKLVLAVGGLLAVVILAAALLIFSRRPAVPSSEASPEPVSVLVADFQNNTGDSLFEDTLENSLSIGLEDAANIDIYKRTNARDVAEKIDPAAQGTLDARMAQLVSLREKINVVVEGEIEPRGDGYEIKIRALDPVESKTLVEVSERIRSKADWFKAMARLASNLRSKLGGVPPELTEELSKETFTTTSLEAMKAYVRAQELNRKGDREEAIQEYLQAIEDDPYFGRAYSGLSLIYYNRGQEKKGEEYFQKAIEQIDRMSEREKYRTRGIYFLINRNTQKAIEEFSALVQRYPADSAGQTNLALAYFWAHDFARAAEVGSRAVKLQPQNIIPRYNLAWSALAIGDYILAEQEAGKVLEINPAFDEAYLCLALSKLAQGQPDQAAEIYNQMMDLSPISKSLAVMGLADLAVYEGRMADARKLLEGGIALDTEQGQQGYAAYKRALLSRALVFLGERRAALREADQALQDSRSLFLRYSLARTYLAAGEVEKARGLASGLGQELQSEPRACALLIRGEIEMADKNIPGALDLFKEARDFLDTWIGRLALGRAYLEAGAYTEAHAEFEWCLEHRGEATSLFFDDFPTYRYFPAAYYYLGRAQEGMNSAAAPESFRKFLEIKAKAEEVDSMVADARRRLGSD
jgi:serine/threonine protein kinase/tetratricopeptide (TPR) repeat protein